MRRSKRRYIGSVLLVSAAKRLYVVACIVLLMWLLSAWALGWL